MKRRPLCSDALVSPSGRQCRSRQASSRARRSVGTRTAGTIGTKGACNGVGGTHETDAATVTLSIRDVRVRGTLEGGHLVVIGDEGTQIYYRASTATALEGTYGTRNVLSPDLDGSGAVVITRRADFQDGRFVLENVLTREGTTERWTTVERGTYRMTSAGQVVLASDGQAPHSEHAFVFGNDGEHLHVGRLGYMARIDKRTPTTSRMR